MSSTNERKYSDASLTDKDIKVFEAKKAQYFKGSIAVAVVYGVVALALILIVALTESGRILLTTNLKPFVITLVIGIILVIVVMVVQLLSLAPSRIVTSQYDAQACPDYWRLEETPESDLEVIDEEKRMTASSRCVRDTVTQRGQTTHVVTPVHTADVTYEVSDNKLNKAAHEYLDLTNESSEGKVNCNRVYPSALALIDETTFPDSKNNLRCDIAQKCGFAWSAVCP